ncbi:acyltransferase family protein [Sediminivirga luteola]|jgi:surface polysaccharide O-acyltransferase-like enzyme|uniref:Membrane protein n=2 Tax=Sediminivirga luteola TaxID=1774748 RepID=A0A8J2TZL4_9MICO|nr:membrane protein [Sediminivirga luteola]
MLERMALLDRIENRNPRPTSTRWMDAARALAIVAVVAIHNISDTVETRFAEQGSAAWWLAVAIDSAARWAVPVFIMISGALALDPARGVQPREFLIKRFYRIGIPLIVWTGIYIWFRLYVLSGRENGWDPVVAVLRGAPFVQLYFLYVLAGLILLTPFMRLLPAFGSRRLQIGTATILIGIGVLDFLISFTVAVGEPNAATRFVPMMGYYVLGWVLRDVIVSGRRLLLVWAGFLGSVALTALWAGYGPGETPWKAIFDYLSPSVVLMSVCAYLLLHAHLRRRLPFLEWLYPLSFGVFLLHSLLVFGLRRWIGVPDTWLSVLGHGVGLTLLYTVICALITWAAIRIPLLRGAFGQARPLQRRRMKEGI